MIWISKYSWVWACICGFGPGRPELVGPFTTLSSDPLFFFDSGRTVKNISTRMFLRPRVSKPNGVINCTVLSIIVRAKLSLQFNNLSAIRRKKQGYFHICNPSLLPLESTMWANLLLQCILFVTLVEW